jgi:hypothetical protein
MHGPTGIFWANLTPFSLGQAFGRFLQISDADLERDEVRCSLPP